MTINHLEILVEEFSMEAFLFEALPDILPEGTTFSIYTYNGKCDLMRKLPDRLKGYSAWMPENYGIVVLVDRDDEDCAHLKKQLEDGFQNAGIRTKCVGKDGQYSGLSRIAIEELEAWYFGNWKAVLRAFPRLPENIPEKSRYRNCDDISGGTWEAFERICKKSGLFSAGLRKVEAAREIGREFSIHENQSPSLEAVYTGVLSLLNQKERRI